MIKHIFKYSLLIFVFIFCTSCKIKSKEPFTSTSIAMGTVINQTIYGSKDLTLDVLNKLKDIEENLLSWRIENSEISFINSKAGSKKNINISEELCNYLDKSLDICKKSNGALDITIGKISRLWDLGGDNPRVPDTDEIYELLPYTGYEKINFSHENKTLTLPEKMSIDLGSTGKGIACDEIKKMFDESKSVNGAVISVGGSVLVYGQKEKNTDWNIGISNPRGENLFASIRLNETTYISTSGDYEKYIIQDGIRYHHILNPKTGYPADNGLISVTIICNSGVLSDGLSTACFVLGLEDGFNLIKQYNAKAIIVDNNKNVYISKELKDYVNIIDKDYTVSNYY